MNSLSKSFSFVILLLLRYFWGVSHLFCLYLLLYLFIQRLLSPEFPRCEEVSIAELKKELEMLTQRFKKLSTTTEQLLSMPMDALAQAYDDASIVQFWLPSPAHDDSEWPGQWSKHQVNNPIKKERDVIQPFVNLELTRSFPVTSPYDFVNTSGGFDGKTQDATLFLRDHSRVSLTTAAIFEWVGQNESPFPSKAHKAKFVRDCMRVYSECGKTREVHGAITDFSRIVAVKLTGLSRDRLPTLQRTSVGDGEMVRKMLTQFAFAEPAALGITKNVAWIFRNGGENRFEAKRVLGSGIHGRVFSVVQDESKFVKVFKVEEELRNEESALRALNDKNVPFIPILHGIDADKLAMLASPLGVPVDDMQGSTAAWILGSMFVKCLQKVHEAGWCHRDVRPANMAYLQNGSSITGDSEVILFDWASAVQIGQEAHFVGTVHYAAKEVLEALYREDIPVPAPEHDLESLVYSIYDLSRQVTSRPRALHISGSVNSHTMQQYVTEVKVAWEIQISESVSLASLVANARNCRYGELIKEMLLRGN